MTEPTMTPENQHLAEKIEVRVAAVIAAVISWWAIWLLVGPMDHESAWVFFAGGGAGRLAIFAAMAWALAAVCAVLTVSSRPEGAVLATLVGVSAMSVRSGPVRNLLGTGVEAEKHVNGIFALLSGEMLVLAGILAGVVVVVYVVRALIRPVAGRWFWLPPAAKADPDGNVGKGKARQTGEENASSGRSGLVGAAGFLAVELAAGVILLNVTFRSTETGQIAFALAASFFVAAFAAHMMFPIRSSIPALLGPVLVGTLVLALGALGNYAGPGPLWSRAIMVASAIPLRAALPVQWIGLGCGGAVAGFWASCRFREAPEELPRTS